jgi:hypothetical protein
MPQEIVAIAHFHILIALWQGENLSHLLYDQMIPQMLPHIWPLTEAHIVMTMSTFAGQGLPGKVSKAYIVMTMSTSGDPGLPGKVSKAYIVMTMSTFAGQDPPGKVFKAHIVMMMLMLGALCFACKIETNTLNYIQ